jgi:hypothetical protein
VTSLCSKTCFRLGCRPRTWKSEIQTPMAQGRSTTIISMIQWTRTSRLSIKISLWGIPPRTAAPHGVLVLVLVPALQIFFGHDLFERGSSFGFRVSDFGSRVLGCGFQVLVLGFGFGFRICGFRSGISDFGLQASGRRCKLISSWAVDVTLWRGVYASQSTSVTT